jgi:hypothetical protein
VLHIAQALPGVDISPRVWQVTILQCSAIFKKYLQCVLAARILTFDFVVCTLAVKKKIRTGFDISDQTIPLSVLSRPQPHVFKVLPVASNGNLETRAWNMFHQDWVKYPLVACPEVN